MLKKMCRFKFFLPIFCLVCSAGVLLICSKSSPLYPFNDWVDANTYFTVGRGMLHGLVPYRDLIDQKGPLLFTIQMLGAIVSPQSFIGVWLLEVLSGTVFLFFSGKIILLFCNKRWGIAGVSVIALLTFTCEAFSSGNSAEEFSLPFLAFALYLFCRAFQASSTWQPNAWMFYICGLGAGFLLWMKYTLLGLHFAWMATFALFFLLKEKRLKKAIQVCLIFLGGMATITLPVLFYFGINGALPDLFEVYFYRNIFSYAKEPRHWSEPFYNMIMSGWDTLRANPVLMGLDLIAAAAILFSKKIFVAFGRFSFFALVFFSGLFVWGGARGYPYYGLVFACFSCLGIAVIGHFFSARIQLPAPVKNGFLAVLCIVCLGASYFFSSNVSSMRVKKEELVQAKFAAIMNTEGGTTLLNYGFLDGGFYTFADIIPTCKYFCRMNLSNNKELEALARGMVEAGAFDFVVVREEEAFGGLDLRYEKVCTEYQFLDGTEYPYSLFRKKA